MNAGANIVGVITAPDKPAGRGMHLHKSAVKIYAEEKGLNILQPVKLKDPEFLRSLKELNPDLGVVVAFRMLPDEVWNFPPMGTINLHGSLLPQYRGAAPINRAIMNGEKETGVTTFKLKHEIDTGDILLTAKTSIGEDENAGELHDRLKMIGAELMVRTIKGIADGSLKEVPQIFSSDLKKAPKIFKEDCKIDNSKSVNEVYDIIRGLSPYPGAFTFINGKMIKIYSGVKSFEAPLNNPLAIKCSDGYIIPTEVQMEGKKRMKAEEFLKGFRA